jgi:hypothetical protein
VDAAADIANICICTRIRKMRILLLDICINIMFLLTVIALLLSTICVLDNRIFRSILVLWLILNNFKNNLSYFYCFWLVLIFLSPNLLKIY